MESLLFSCGGAGDSRKTGALCAGHLMRSEVSVHAEFVSSAMSLHVVVLLLVDVGKEERCLALTLRRRRIGIECGRAECVCQNWRCKWNGQQQSCGCALACEYGLACAELAICVATADVAHLVHRNAGGFDGMDTSLAVLCVPTNCGILRQGLRNPETLRIKGVAKFASQNRREGGRGLDGRLLNTAS